MWALWFFPLIILLLLIGTAVGAGWFFFSPRDRRPKLAAIVAVPIGCAALPVLGLVLLAVVSRLIQKSDTQLYDEVFGYRPTITEDRMIFNDIGRDETREIFMRAEPTDAERKKLLAIPGIIESDFPLDQFIARGVQRGFGWWMSADTHDDTYCKSARIFAAPGFRGWAELHIAECLDAGTKWPASSNVENIYVIASGRSK